MAPKEPGTPLDFRPPHMEVAYTTALDKPSRFYGGCAAGDFYAAATRDTQEAARADVAEHLAEVTRQPHRAFVNMVSKPPHGFLGFCAAGDYSPGLVRATHAEAEADVAAHLLEMEQAAAARNKPPEGGSCEHLTEGAKTDDGSSASVRSQPSGGQP